MPTDYCFIVSIKANPSWLALQRDARDKHWQDASTVIKEYINKVTFQYYDCDAFHAHLSDMIICETKEPLLYHHLWDRLKDTSLFSEAFYSITDVRFGIKGVSHG